MKLTNFNSLSNHFIIWQFVSLAIFTFSICGALYLALSTEIAWVDDQTLQKRYLTVRAMLASEEDRAFWLAHEVSEDMEGPRRIFVRILGPGGALIEETPDMAKLAPAGLFPTVRNGVRHTNIQTTDGNKFRVYVASAPMIKDGIWRKTIVQVAIDTTLDEVVLAKFPLTMLAVALLALAVATILSFMMVKRLLRPLQLIAREIGTIDHSKLDRRVRLSGLTCELQQLGLAFNGLMGDLESAYQGLRQYADNVAHEVRTPLNNMLLGLELAGQGGRDAETYEEAINAVQDECRQLVTLVDRLLFLARVDGKQADIERHPLNISSEIQRIHEYFEASAGEAGIRLTCSPGEAVAASGDKVLLRRAIANLVANALAHTPKGGAVHIGAQRKAASVEITVSDTGTGIEEADLPYVFDRFYRANAPRSSKFGRVGLGLPIAKSIVELHAGSISLASGVGQGTLAKITLPIVERATISFR